MSWGIRIAVYCGSRLDTYDNLKSIPNPDKVTAIDISCLMPTTTINVSSYAFPLLRIFTAESDIFVLGAMKMLSFCPVIEHFSARCDTDWITFPYCPFLTKISIPHYRMEYVCLDVSQLPSLRHIIVVNKMYNPIGMIIADRLNIDLASKKFKARGIICKSTNIAAELLVIGQTDYPLAVQKVAANMEEFIKLHGDPFELLGIKQSRLPIKGAGRR